MPLKCQRNRFGISKQQIELWSSISVCLWCTYTGLFEWPLFRALYLSHSFSRWHRTGTNGNKMLNMLNMHHISCYTRAEEDATFFLFRNLICRYSNEHCDGLSLFGISIIARLNILEISMGINSQNYKTFILNRFIVLWELK